jgi:hypothetical protein
MSKHNRPSSSSERQADFKGVPKWVPILIAGIITGALIWKLLIEPFAQWIRQNALTVSVAAFVLGVLIIAGCVFVWKRLEKLKEEKDEILNVLDLKGFQRYTDESGNSRWGTEEEIEEWKKEDELFIRVRDLIRSFPPPPGKLKEDSYRRELQGWLKRDFPKSKTEVVAGSCRADIAIEHICIEVKGPTYDGDLQTIEDKCERYLKRWNKIIFVFFEPKYSPEMYNDIIKPLLKRFPGKIEFIIK